MDINTWESFVVNVALLSIPKAYLVLKPLR